MENLKKEVVVKYPEHKDIHFAEVARDILEFWDNNQVFERSITEKEGNETFTFYEGPPSANGTPGIHHVMARAVKDIFCRFKTMQGYQVKRKGGWDTHGLPVELQVEKELGISKDDIGHSISVEDYNARCREAVMKYKGEWEYLTRKMGYWIDLNDPYITFDNDYIESVWYLLKKFYDKGLLYKGYTIQPYSPAAGTGLSSHELNQPGCYKMVKDTSITAQFKVKRDQKSEKLFQTDDEKWQEVFFLAWTTTPWTLPSNTALAVGENITYVKIKTFNVYTYQPIMVVLAKECINDFFSDKAKEKAIEDYNPGDKIPPYEIMAEYSGKELLNIEYEQLLPYVQPEKPAFKVIPGDFVTTEEGTGIVHIAPTFGADDMRVANKNDIPALTIKDEKGNDMPLVDKKGKFVDKVTDFAGMYVKNYNDQDESDPDYKPTDVLITIKLKKENKAFKVEKYEHTYPHCWRTDKPVLYYPLESWFIKTTEYKDKLVEKNKTINWKPESTGTGRFGNWLENLVDWNLSRSRFWGTPLPIWKTEDGSEEICIGSIEELKDKIREANNAGENNSLNIKDLHRPYVDEIVLRSSQGKRMYRETDLIDVWFDSGAMPYAQWHYPFDNQETFNKNYPADFIAEGIDQTRGWFFTLHTIAVMLFDSIAFRNVISNGLVLDKNGNKMSKRLGNAIDPIEVMDQYGPDAVRWYMIHNSPPWENLKFDKKGLEENQRKFFGTLQNTYNFFVLYANIDGFDYQDSPIPVKDRTESDQWIISRLNSLITQVTEAYNSFEPTRATREIQEFTCEDLSNWYVRLNRKRFWRGEYNEDKKAAYQTLYECLETISKLMAPVSPFYSDKIFRDLEYVSGREKADSVHLSRFPHSNKEVIDESLEKKMFYAQKISSLIHSIRKANNLRVRLPLSRVLIPVVGEDMKKHIQGIEELINYETNVKKVELIESTKDIVKRQVKPNFRKLGKEYGKKVQEIAGIISSLTDEEVIDIEKGNTKKVSLQDGTPVTLTLEDLDIRTEDIPGWSVATDDGITVALDINITDDLKQEGIARDFVNRIQNLRKDKNLDVQDKINIVVDPQYDMVNNALKQYQEYICNETQALELKLDNTSENATIMNMEEFELKIDIEKPN